MDSAEELINHKSIVFLRRASLLPLSNIHLRADLAVSSRNYGSISSKKELVCVKCCLKVTHDMVTFKLLKLKKKRRLLKSNCTYCGQQLISAVILRKDSDKSANLTSSLMDLSPSTSDVINKKSLILPSKKRVKTLTKLASLNDKNRNQVVNKSSNPLLDFMNSLKS